MTRSVSLALLFCACRSPSAGYIDDVLGDCDGRFRDPGPYPNQLVAGDGLSRLTLEAPEAVCNDRTPAVLYVRRGSDDWVMHLQGGGTCTTFESCEARYCGSDYHDASKMSSAFAPARIEAVGLESDDPENRFAAATQVYFYYCTSDAWSGVSVATLVAEDGREMMLQRNGHAIVEAAFDLLRSPQTSDDGNQTLPDLDDAKSLLFTGTSGGSAGAQIHLDWVRSRMDPSVPVFGVFDASFVPRPELLPDGPADRLRNRARDSVAGLAVASAVPPFSDESCQSALGGTADDWKCFDPASFAYDYITTPFLARQDLYDANVIGAYLQAGVSEEAFAEAVRASLLSLAKLPETAIEGAAMAAVPSAYGPACGQHVALETNAWFFDGTVLEGDLPVSLHDAVYTSSTEGATVSVVDGVDSERSYCVGVDEEH